MPADQLTPSPDSATLHGAVLEVLGGAELGQVAHRTEVSAPDLRAAVEVFTRAGRQALTEQSGWWQANVEFTAWENADEVALDHLAPALRQSGAPWWFIRKHPCWRIRMHAGPGAVRDAVSQGLEELTRLGHLRGWSTAVYEPEVPAFGGPVGMEIAHRLFHVDSQALLDHGFGEHGEHGDLGPRELSVLLCVTLMRGAVLEWYEQADVWDRVCRERPLPEGVPAARLRELSENVRVLLLADTSSDGAMFGTEGSAAHVNVWAQAFRSAGEQMKACGRSGTLERGLRELVGYHVIFHWNRMGLASNTQSALAHAAKAAILETS